MSSSSLAQKSSSLPFPPPPDSLLPRSSTPSSALLLQGTSLAQRLHEAVRHHLVTVSGGGGDVAPSNNTTSGGAQQQQQTIGIREEALASNIMDIIAKTLMSSQTDFSASTNTPTTTTAEEGSLLFSASGRLAEAIASYTLQQQQQSQGESLKSRNIATNGPRSSQSNLSAASSSLLDVIQLRLVASEESLTALESERMEKSGDAGKGGGGASDHISTLNATASKPPPATSSPRNANAAPPSSSSSETAALALLLSNVPSAKAAKQQGHGREEPSTTASVGVGGGSVAARTDFPSFQFSLSPKKSIPIVKNREKQQRGGSGDAETERAETHQQQQQRVILAGIDHLTQLVCDLHQRYQQVQERLANIQLVEAKQRQHDNAVLKSLLSHHGQQHDLTTTAAATATASSSLSPRAAQKKGKTKGKKGDNPFYHSYSGELAKAATNGYCGGNTHQLSALDKDCTRLTPNSSSSQQLSDNPFATGTAPIVLPPITAAAAAAAVSTSKQNSSLGPSPLLAANPLNNNHHHPPTTSHHNQNNNTTNLVHVRLRDQIQLNKILSGEAPSLVVVPKPKPSTATSATATGSVEGAQSSSAAPAAAAAEETIPMMTDPTIALLTTKGFLHHNKLAHARQALQQKQLALNPTTTSSSSLSSPYANIKGKVMRILEEKSPHNALRETDVVYASVDVVDEYQREWQREGQRRGVGDGGVSLVVVSKKESEKQKKEEKDQSEADKQPVGEAEAAGGDGNTDANKTNVKGKGGGGKASDGPENPFSKVNVHAIAVLQQRRRLSSEKVKHVLDAVHKEVQQYRKVKEAMSPEAVRRRTKQMAEGLRPATHNLTQSLVTRNDDEDGGDEAD